MKVALAVVLLVNVLTCQSQTRVINQGSYWIRYYNQTQFTDKLALHFNVDERRLINPSRQFQLFFHVQLNYLIRPWIEIGAGGNFNWTNSTQNVDLRIPEWRPWQEVTFIKPMPRNFQFQFRYRLDERFIHYNDGLELTDGYHFNWRHRFRPQLSYTLSNPKRLFKSLVFKVSDDIMLNSGDVKDVFDQNRLYGSIQYPISKKLSIEVGYLNQFQSRLRYDGFYDRHILRVTAYHRVDARKASQTKSE